MKALSKLTPDLYVVLLFIFLSVLSWPSPHFCPFARHISKQTAIYWQRQTNSVHPYKCTRRAEIIRRTNKQEA